MTDPSPHLGSDYNHFPQNKPPEHNTQLKSVLDYISKKKMKKKKKKKKKKKPWL